MDDNNNKVIYYALKLYKLSIKNILYLIKKLIYSFKCLYQYKSQSTKKTFFNNFSKKNPKKTNKKIRVELLLKKLNIYIIII